MANQMQPATRGSLASTIYAILITVVGGTLFLAFCGPAVERAVKQVDEISKCREDTDECNAAPEPDLPSADGVPANPDGTPYGTCRARYPVNETGALPPDADFDANYPAPEHCYYVQLPSGPVVAASSYNQTPERMGNGSGGRIFNWGSFLRVFGILIVLIFGWYFIRKYRHDRWSRKQRGTLGTQPVDPATGGPKFPVPVPVPGAPQDDDFDDDDDDEIR